jgi:hypothetical protein
MTKKHSRALTAVLVALLVPPIGALDGVVTASGAGATTTPRVLTCGEKLAAKPVTYVLSCADANAEWTTMAWSVWNTSSATGRGVLRQNDCKPNCAAGTFFNYRASVTLSNVVATKKHGTLFSKATFHYRAGGKAKIEVFELAD